jgi:hypothetical protein
MKPFSSLAILLSLVVESLSTTISDDGTVRKDIDQPQSLHNLSHDVIERVIDYIDAPDGTAAALLSTSKHTHALMESHGITANAVVGSLEHPVAKESTCDRLQTLPGRLAAIRHLFITYEVFRKCRIVIHLVASHLKTLIIIDQQQSLSTNSYVRQSRKSLWTNLSHALSEATRLDIIDVNGMGVVLQAIMDKEQTHESLLQDLDLYLSSNLIDVNAQDSTGIHHSFYILMDAVAI